MVATTFLWALLPLLNLAVASPVKQHAVAENADPLLKPRQYLGSVFYYESDCETYYSQTCYTCVYSTDWCPSGMCLYDGSCGSTSSDTSNTDTSGTDYSSNDTGSSTGDTTYDTTSSDDTSSDDTTTYSDDSSTEDTTTHSSHSGGKKLSPAALKGLIAGVVIVVAIVIGIFSWLCVARRNKKIRQRQQI